MLMKTRKAGPNSRRKGDRKLERRPYNHPVVETGDSMRTATQVEINRYRDQMKMLTHSTELPAFEYKGRLIPRRVLTDFSYLTNGDVRKQ